MMFFPPSPVLVTAPSAEVAAPTVQIQELPDVSDDTEAASEADTDATNPLSKAKLKRMSLDKLKDLCRERALDTEGSKSMLADRLLGVIR